ncbi:MAG: Spy/CpxP family protein refolding chaperone [Candidatus Marinimicrobia bacterium]|nr:Spy/CpxP family protein refolding chaperone [Candidatus Neomarinimicrobiota bacterium]
MKKYLTLSMLILITSVFGQGRGGFGRELGWNDDLNLTSEQIKKIDSYRTDFRKEQIDLRADIQKMRLDLQDLLRTDEPNQKAINNQLEKIQAKELAMEKLRVEHHLQVRELLTDEQKTLFDQHSLNRGMGRHGKGRMDGRGDRDGSGGRGNDRGHGNRGW